MSDLHNLEYYLKCMMGGILACGITHVAIVPLDVIKCKLQIDNSYCSGIIDGVKKINSARQLTLGWAPTLVGYSVQGMCRFGFYEIFKDVYKHSFSEETAIRYRKVGWAIAAASAEAIADIFLCPW